MTCVRALALLGLLAWMGCGPPGPRVLVDTAGQGALDRSEGLDPGVAASCPRSPVEELQCAILGGPTGEHGPFHVVLSALGVAGRHPGAGLGTHLLSLDHPLELGRPVVLASAPGDSRGASQGGAVAVVAMDDRGALVVLAEVIGNLDGGLLRALSLAEDIDLDGVPDVVFGAPGADLGRGRAYVVSGAKLAVGATLRLPDDALVELQGVTVGAALGSAAAVPHHPTSLDGTLLIGAVDAGAVWVFPMDTVRAAVGEVLTTEHARGRLHDGHGLGADIVALSTGTYFLRSDRADVVVLSPTGRLVPLAPTPGAHSIERLEMADGEELLGISGSSGWLYSPRTGGMAAVVHNPGGAVIGDLVALPDLDGDGLGEVGASSAWVDTVGTGMVGIVRGARRTGGRAVTLDAAWRRAVSPDPAADLGATLAGLPDGGGRAALLTGGPRAGGASMDAGRVVPWVWLEPG